MEPVFCVHCTQEFTPRNRLQSYCSKSKCQRARKAAWQRVKIKTDPDYRAAKKLSHQKWAANNTGYWKNYRADHPEKAERNRMLQTIRNRRRLKAVASGHSAIAKMDARKVNIYTMPEPWR